MCGIFGLINTVRSPKIEDVGKAIGLLQHRGPDGSGIWSDDKVALAHHRLAIFDPSDAGDQPMMRDGVVLVFNGAIYNYRRLRNDLQDKGYVFASDSDTEVVLCSYLDRGIDCVEEFNGQWSMAIWDSRAQELYLSRDRFGIKPLYICDYRGGMAFSSEIKAFSGLPDWTPRLNRAMAYDWLAYGKINHSAETLYQGVVRVPASHTMRLEAADTINMTENRYYNLGQLTKGFKDKDLFAEFAETLNDAVTIRLQGDRQMGLTLSGGLDSSAIAAEVWPTAPNLPTFSVVYDDPAISEKDYVKAIRERFNFPSSCIAPEFAGFMEDLRSLLWHQEGPVGGFGVYAQYCLHRQASTDNVQVLLGGQGADEILAGYPRFYLPVIKDSFRRNPLRGVRDYWEVKGRFSELRPMDWKHIKRFLVGHPSKPKWLRLEAPKSMEPSKSKVCTMRDISIDLVEGRGLQTLLHYEDRNSMAHGIESRMPFLDHRLVELCCSMPDDYKIKDLWSKWILRKTIENKVPPSIAWRRNKLGFATPEKKWLVHHRNEILAATSPSLCLNQIIHTDAIPNLSGSELFRVFTFSVWSQIFEVEF